MYIYYISFDIIAITAKRRRERRDRTICQHSCIYTWDLQTSSVNHARERRNIDHHSYLLQGFFESFPMQLQDVVRDCVFHELHATEQILTSVLSHAMGLSY